MVINLKQRILTGVIGIPLLLIVFFIHPLVFAVAISLVCGAGTYEILKSTGHKNRSIMAAAIAFSALMPFFVRIDDIGISPLLIVLGYLLVLVLVQIRHHDSLSIGQVGFAFTMSLIYPFAFSCLSYLREMDGHGIFYALLALIIPWLSDIGAYFVGTLIGKHKLCPTISPKKTVEGFVGGFVVSVGASLLAAFVYQSMFLGDAAAIRYWLIAVAAFIGAPLSVAGDLFASVVKRQYSVKDFGNVFPGHGGVIDRFDSLLFVTPLLFLIIRLIPMVV